MVSVWAGMMALSKGGETMTRTQNVFQRTEKKYLLNPEQHLALEQALRGQMVPDDYGVQTIANIYYDTPDCLLIRRSLDKPIYKEKLRIRSYARVEKDSKVFVELKKKFKDVVYKRREVMCLKDAELFLAAGIALHPLSQIQREIDWFRTFHGVIPRAFIAYERQAYLDSGASGLRLTFDTNIRCRDRDLSLSASFEGNPVLPEDQTLMEVKAAGAMPLWLAEMLAGMSIYPASFSKYGRFYQEGLIRETTDGGRQIHVA